MHIFNIDSFWSIPGMLYWFRASFAEERRSLVWFVAVGSQCGRTLDLEVSQSRKKTDKVPGNHFSMVVGAMCSPISAYISLVSRSMAESTVTPITTVYHLSHHLSFKIGDWMPVVVYLWCLGNFTQKVLQVQYYNCGWWTSNMNQHPFRIFAVSPWRCWVCSHMVPNNDCVKLKGVVQMVGEKWGK